MLTIAGKCGFYISCLRAQSLKIVQLKSTRRVKIHEQGSSRIWDLLNVTTHFAPFFLSFFGPMTLKDRGAIIREKLGRIRIAATLLKIERSERESEREGSKQSRTAWKRIPFVLVSDMKEIIRNVIHTERVSKNCIERNACRPLPPPCCD